MDKRIDVCLNMDVLMNELKEALSREEVKTDAGERDLSGLTEKLVLLFSIKEYDLLLLFIKTLSMKHNLVLPDIFNQIYCNHEWKESFCAVIIKNWITVVCGV